MTHMISIFQVNNHPLKSHSDDFIVTLKVFCVKWTQYEDEREILVNWIFWTSFTLFVSNRKVK